MFGSANIFSYLRCVYMHLHVSLLQKRATFHFGLKHIIWASLRQNLSLGFPLKGVSNQSPQLQRLARKLKFLHMILFKKLMTKALIRLRRCAGWSAPVLFANPGRQVSSRRGPFGYLLKLVLMISRMVVVVQNGIGTCFIVPF